MSSDVKQLEDVDALILAGGLGTRLRSVVADRPKVLADVNGRPFLSYLLDDLCRVGIQRVVLSTGYMGEQVRAAFGQSYRGMDIAYAQEPSPLGTGGAMRYALPSLDSDPVLVMNGDSVHRADLGVLLGIHERHRASGTLVVTRVGDTSRYGRVELERDEVVGFREKGAHSGEGWVNAGIYMLSASLIEAIPEGRRVSFETEVLPGWVGRGLHGLRSHGGFLDIGTPDDYGQAHGFFARELAS